VSAHDHSGTTRRCNGPRRLVRIAAAGFATAASIDCAAA